MSPLVPADSDKEWITPEVATRYFGRSLRTIRRWLSDGTLKDFGYETRRSGRFILIRVKPERLAKMSLG